MNKGVFLIFFGASRPNHTRQKRVKAWKRCSMTWTMQWKKRNCNNLKNLTGIEILVNYFYRKNIFFHCELQLLDIIRPLRYFSTPQGKIQSAGPGGGWVALLLFYSCPQPNSGPIFYNVTAKTQSPLNLLLFKNVVYIFKIVHVLTLC